MTSKVLKSMNSKFNKICVHIYMNVYINTYIKIYFRYIANITPCPVTPFKGVLRKSCSENMQEIYRRTPMPKCNFNKVASQLCWNHTLSWVLCCKFATYFQNIFSWEHLWRAASVFYFFCNSILDCLYFSSRHC